MFVADPQDNPLSSEDDRLREDAPARARRWNLFSSSLPKHGTEGVRLEGAGDPWSNGCVRRPLRRLSIGETRRRAKAQASGGPRSAPPILPLRTGCVAAPLLPGERRRCRSTSSLPQ